MNKKTVDELLTETERRWLVVTKARRAAVEAENKYKEALYKWLEEGDTHAAPTPEDSSS